MLLTHSLMVFRHVVLFDNATVFHYSFCIIPCSYEGAIQFLL